MAKDEMMELGCLILRSELRALYFKNIHIQEMANEHGWLSVTFVPEKKVTQEDVIRCQGSRVQICTLDGDTVFSGVWTFIGLSGGNEYKEVYAQAATLSVQVDEEKKTASFQDTGKTLNYILQRGIGTKALVNTDSDPVISEMLSQENETDWEFNRRIANQYQKLLFVNSKSPGCQIHVGAAPFQIKALGTVQDTSTLRNVDKVREIQGSTSPKASVFEFEETALTVYDLTIGVGYAVSYQGRTQTVTKSEIFSRQGIILNRITLANQEGTMPSASQSMGSTKKCSILTGTVTDRDQTNVKVDFASPEDVPRWMPYAHAVSNYFYSMPDIGDTVFVYYETGDSGKIVCLGSRHVNDSPDFVNYKDKMLTANNRMIKFSEKELSLIGNREEFDGLGGEQAKIVFNDQNGIEITSTKDISLETTDAGEITIQSVKGDYAGIDAVKKRFTQKYEEGNAAYEADGGTPPEFNALAYLATSEFNKIKENVVQNITAPFQVIGTIKELGGRIGGSDGTEGEAAAEEAPPEFSDGVVDILALEKMVIQVGSTCMIFSDGIIQIRTDTYMQLGTDRNIAYEHLEDTNYTWRDMFLDVTQCALDIVGVLPIPGLSTAANLVNAGISMARGDYIGAAMSAGTALMSVIPGGNTLAAPAMAAKVLDKAGDAGKAVRTVMKIAKMLSTGANGLNMALQTGMAAYDLGTAAFSGEFDWNDPDCRQDMMALIQGAGEFGKGKIEKNKKKDPETGKERWKTKGEREAERTARKDTRRKAARESADRVREVKEKARAKMDEYSANRCKGGDPIDMVTGSYAFDQCDMIINDILQIYPVERTYESLLASEDSPIGRGWTLSLFSRAVLYDDRIEILLPDNHTETFLRTQGGFSNRRNGTRRITLQRKEDGYRMEDEGTGLSWIYDKSGQVQSIADRNGNRTLYRYQGNTLQSILFASGQYIKFRWKGDKITAMEDCIGRTVRYHYQENLLKEVELVNGGVEQYAYDTEGRLTEVTDANGVTYVHNEYDDKNRVTRQRLSTGQEYVLFYGEEERANTMLSVESGKRLRYAYNRKRQLIRTEYPDGTCEEFSYDEWENKIWEKDRRGNETHRMYDTFSHLLEERLSNGLVRFYDYDEKGNCIRSRDNAGCESNYRYEERTGRLLKESRKLDTSLICEVFFEYDSFGRVTAFTDANGNREVYRYKNRFFQADTFISAGGSEYRYEMDAAGRVMEVRDEDGIHSYAYNHYDFLCRETDPLGNITKYRYDRALNLVQVVTPNHDDPHAPQETGAIYRYDAFHRQISRTDETGAVFATLRNGEGNIVKEVHPDAWEERKQDGEGITYFYDENDNVSLTRYPDGGVERSWYDTAGNLLKICLPEQYHEKEDSGEGYCYEYDCMNRLTQITAPDGTIQKRYVYDLHGNVIKEMDAAGIAMGDTDEERTGTLYAYNYAGWLLERRQPVREKDGEVDYRLTQYRYDRAGNLLEEKRYCGYQTRTGAEGAVHSIFYTYDRENRVTEVRDRSGAEIAYGYDSQGRRISESHRINDTAVQKFYYRYDAAGRMTELIRSADKEGCGREQVKLCYEYDRNGNNTRMLLPTGARIQREYDAADRLVAETHEDKAGGILNTTRFAYDRTGNLTRITDHLGRETVIEYDRMNRAVLRKEKDGAVTRQVYDQNGQLKKVIRPKEYALHGEEGAGVRYTYDENGRVTTVRNPDGSIRESHAYDADGRLLQTTDGMGSRAEFRYDLGGRRTGIRTGGQASQQYEYDAGGNITGIVDGAGNRTEYVPDAWGRITEIRKADGSSESYAYDYAGNLTKTTDGEGNTAIYEYNSINRLARFTDPEGAQERYLYDAGERLCKKTDRNGTDTHYAYNMYGSLLLKRAGELSERYEYTPEGFLKSAISGSPVSGTNPSVISMGMRYSYRYDAMGRLKEKAASGRTLSAFEYDLNGNLTRQSDITGRITEYSYNLSDQIESVRDDGRKIAEYTYYADGTIQSVRNGESLYTEYRYDADKNLTGLLTTLGSDILVDNRYRYDGNGNRIEKQQKHGLTAYTYDSVNRLTEVRYPDRKETLFYDRAGNRTGRISGGAEERYRYDKRNCLLSLHKDGAVTSFLYDNAGNLLRDDRAKYEYDAFNRNTKVETFDGNIQINRYDAEGLRHEMEENGKLVFFLFRGGEVVAEETKESRIRYIRTHELLASDAESAKTYYHYASDEMGSITHLTDEAGTVLNRYEYDAWGNPAVCEETIENRFQFNGQQLDPVSRQYYLRARFYNPVIGRFTQEDTYRGDGLNLYAYCANNPVYYVDPSGHICEKRANEIMGKLAAGGTLYNSEGKKLAAYLRNKEHNGGLTDAERKMLGQVDRKSSAAGSKGGSNPANNIVKQTSPDFIVTPEGTALPTNTDYNLVSTTQATNKGGEYLQIHNSHTHGDLTNPHVHKPQININPETGIGSSKRLDLEINASDINYADEALRSGTLRIRINRKDVGGY